MSDSSHPAALRIRESEAFVRIPFKPVPVKARHDGWTPERQRDFIDRLCVTGNVARSARAVGKTPQSAYRLRKLKGAASFARAWDKALDNGESYQVDVGIARGLHPEPVPIMRLGRCVGMAYRYDNRLTMATLKALDRRAARSIADPVAVLDAYLNPPRNGEGDHAQHGGGVGRRRPLHHAASRRGPPPRSGAD